MFLDLCLTGHIMFLRATIYWVCYYDSGFLMVLCYCSTTEGLEFGLYFFFWSYRCEDAKIWHGGMLCVRRFLLVIYSCWFVVKHRLFTYHVFA